MWARLRVRWRQLVLVATTVRHVNCDYEEIAYGPFKSHPAYPFAAVVAFGHDFVLGSRGQYDADSCSCIVFVYEIAIFIFGSSAGDELVRSRSEFVLGSPQLCYCKHIVA